MIYFLEIKYKYITIAALLFFNYILCYNEIQAILNKFVFCAHKQSLIKTSYEDIS